MARSRKKIGEILAEWGVVSKDAVEKAAAGAKGTGKRLGDVLIEAGLAKEEQVAKALATQFGYEFFDPAASGNAASTALSTTKRGACPRSASTTAGTRDGTWPLTKTWTSDSNAKRTMTASSQGELRTPPS